MFLGRYLRGNGVLTKEVQGEFGLREELVPKEIGEGIKDAGKDGKEVGFKSVDDTFRYIVAMDIWRDKMESAVPLANNGATILGASPIVEYFEINAVALGFEARQNFVIGVNVIPVIV